VSFIVNVAGESFFKHMHPTAALTNVLARSADKRRFWVALFIEHSYVVQRRIADDLEVKERFMKSGIIFNALDECGDIQVASYHNFLKRYYLVFKIY
jgi:hypothetical protein